MKEKLLSQQAGSVPSTWPPQSPDSSVALLAVSYPITTDVEPALLVALFLPPEVLLAKSLPQPGLLSWLASSYSDLDWAST
jgi:hypothetical protein